MARLENLPVDEAKHLLSIPCPEYHDTDLAGGPPLPERRLALVSTAGLHLRSDRPFGVGAGGYRIIPGDAAAGDLVMTHISTNFDRTGFQQDLNVVFPLDRLKDLVAAGEIGSLAGYHYSFMGATDPGRMADTARSLARIMKNDGVDAVLLVPV